MNRVLVSADNFCRARPIFAIILYLAASLMLASACGVIPKMHLYFPVFSLGPISYLCWAMALPNVVSSSWTIAFFVLHYIFFSVISVLFLRLYLRQKSRFRLTFGIVGAFMWFFAGLHSFYTIAQF